MAREEEIREEAREARGGGGGGEEGEGGGQRYSNTEPMCTCNISGGAGCYII